MLRHEGLVGHRGTHVTFSGLPTWKLYRFRSEILIRDHGEQMPYAAQARELLYIGVDDEPRCLLDVGVREHVVLGA